MINPTIKGTKAETLEKLLSLGYNVPITYFFEVQEWQNNESQILTTILNKFTNDKLAIRSSTKAEDTEEHSMAGAFESLLNITCERIALKNAINEVIRSYDDNLTNQVLIQPMVRDVAMSGVLMTQVLDDGSPYYVANYDDTSGLTDTVTSGLGINKTVYIYNGVQEEDFDSPYLLALLNLTRELQQTFTDIPLDIEFAIDNHVTVHILQVRRITTSKSWDQDVIDKVSERMVNLKKYVNEIMQPRPYLYGQTTLLGIMPDWNPAEMIGVVPRPMAQSLYRKLITERTWRIAREKMGYRKMPNIELMVSLYGRVYIDVRNSLNSLLPAKLNSNICEKLINAYLNRLKENPQLHDKIEFEVIHTAFDFSFDDNFQNRYGNLLTKKELNIYKSSLIEITESAIKESTQSTLTNALKAIDKLDELQKKLDFSEDQSAFQIADTINTLLDECINFGTEPFSILARHAFIAEALLRSANTKGALTSERIEEFRRSIKTVASEMSSDFFDAISNQSLRSAYIKKYGHLRPSSYDILSPNYENRLNLFEGTSKQPAEEFFDFQLNSSEKLLLTELFKRNKINITAEELLHYSKKAIIGREYAKFIFTKHLNFIIELAAKWGHSNGFSREDMSMLSIEDVLDQLKSPLKNKFKEHYKRKIQKAKNDFQVASSFKLSYLIRSVRDVHIVPMQRSSANFIGNQRIECDIVYLTPYSENSLELEGKIICIEGADPGYDWIFTRNIAGLITKYGGTNSHMSIRSAEYGIAAAIGCGEQPFNRIIKAGKCLLDCTGKQLIPIEY